MEDQERLAKFEALLADLEREYLEVESQLKELTAADKQKAATFKQLLARKLALKQFLGMFEAQGLR